MRCVSCAAFAATMAALVMVAATPAAAGIDIYIDKSSQSMSVTVDGGRSYHWPVSTGVGRYDTPGGSFRAIRLERVYYSKKYDDAPMPNSVFFHGGYAIHGTYEEGKLGRPASHGCVRLARGNAALLYELVRTHGMSNTRIAVGGSVGSGFAYSSRRYAPPPRVYRAVPQYYYSEGDLGRPNRPLRARVRVYEYAPPPAVYDERPVRRRYYDDGLYIYEGRRGFRW
ncbi:MAG: L,D-transpeptidase [Pseudolabrys sp.]